MACVLLLVAGLFPPASAQNAAPSATTNAPAEAGTTNAPPAPPPDGNPASTNQDKQIKGPEEIQLSFQGANIDMIVQWLAQTTGKSVVKHPQVQCQLTITSSKKLSQREAINLVYRALALEGFTAVESSNSILLVPEGKEPKLNPELLDASRKDIPEGRQRLVKIFPLEHIQAAELKEKIRGLLSDKGTIDADERVNQLVVTDYNENLKLLAQLINEFDVPESGLVLQIYPLKYGDAEDLGSLISLILSAQNPASTGSGRSSGGASRNSSPPMGGPFPGGAPMPTGDSGGGGASPAAGSSASAQGIRIWPDRTANRLVVSAPKARLAEFERLLMVLDTEKSADVTVRVLPLKNMNAVDLVKDLGPLYEKMGKSPKEMVEVAASDRSNALIVLSSEANFHAFEKLVASLDTEGAQDKIVRTFPLKNADAQDVAKQLQDLNRDQDNSSRYPYYIFFSRSGGDQNTRKMSVVADRRRNSLIVQAPPAQMDGIAAMIEELDAPVGDDSLAPRIYHLKYVSAVDIEDVLNELFLKKTQQRSYYYYFDDNPEPQADRDVGRLYGKVRITSEPYSNTLIITSNSKESLAVLEEVLKQLDQPSEAGESTLRVQLKFAKAPNVANSINILFAKNGSPPLRQQTPQNPQQPNQQQQQPQQGGVSQTSFALEQESKEEGYYPWLGGQPDNPRSTDGRNTIRPVSDLVGRVRAVADQRSNSLLVSANVHFFPSVMKLVEELDAPTPQVLIEARIVEVSSDFLDKLGVRWSPDGSKVFTADDYDNSLLITSSAQYQKGFGGTTTVNNPPPGSASTLPSVLTQLRSGVLSSTINMDFLIQFLHTTTAAKVLAEPQINIADNEMGKLFVGQQVPFINYSQSTEVGSLNQSFQYKDVGVILEVTPHINIGGDVALKIRAESSAIVPGQTLFGGAIIDTRDFRTDLKAKSGETLVLGGIIQKQVTDTLRKTPILGDIPGLGWAFKKRDKTSHEVELMVFLRPKITRTSEESKELLDEIYKKAPHVKDAEDPQPNKKRKANDENDAG